MVWQLERQGRRSSVIGAAHFFPRHFRPDLERLIRDARVVVLEGPLDDASAKKVIDAGKGTGGAAVYEAAKKKINAALGLAAAPFDVHQILKDLVFGRQAQWLEEELRGMKPWAAFFGIWTRYRSRQGWIHSLDLDARRIAQDLGKPIVHLETIEEQIAALDAVPLSRFTRFLAEEDWAEYLKNYERHYSAGELDALVARSQAFPSYCEPIIEARDPILAERMMDELDQGGACVVIGVAHCKGVLANLEKVSGTFFRPAEKGP